MTTQKVVFKAPIVHQFLTDLFEKDWDGVWVAGIRGDPNDNANRNDWLGGRAGDLGPHLSDGDNLYYSTSVLSGDRRKVANFKKTRIFWLDDIDSKIDSAKQNEILAALGFPRWEIPDVQG